MTSIRIRLLSYGYYPRLNFSAVVLCEPMMMAHEFLAQITTNLSGGSENRRDIWPSKQEAYTIMKTRATWKKWDDRVLRTYTVSSITRFSLAGDIWSYICSDMGSDCCRQLYILIWLRAWHWLAPVCKKRYAPMQLVVLKLQPYHCKGMLQRPLGIIPRISFASPHCTESPHSYYLWSGGWPCVSWTPHDAPGVT